MKRPLARHAAPLAALAASLCLVAIPGATAAPGSLTTSYSCTSAFGEEETEVTVGADFPDEVRPGSEVAARKVGFSVTVPADMVDYLRAFGVESVSGRAKKATYRVGSSSHRLRKVKLPETRVPDRGAMVLAGTGRASGFRAPARGSYAIRVPASFAATLRVTGQDGTSSTVAMSCNLSDGAPSRFGTLTVR